MYHSCNTCIPRSTETYRPSDTQPPNPTLITETPSSIPTFVHNPISLPHIAISNPQIQSPKPRSRYSPTPSTSLLLTTILLRLTPPTLPVLYPHMTTFMSLAALMCCHGSSETQVIPMAESLLFLSELDLCASRIARSPPIRRIIVILPQT